MNILKTIFNAVMGSPGKVDKSLDAKKLVADAFAEVEKRQETKLEAAADALASIEAITADQYDLFPSDVKDIHTLAQDGYRAAKGVENESMA